MTDIKICGEDRAEQHATKVIHVIIDGQGICAQKNPITDAFEKSDDIGFYEAEDFLQTVFLNGELVLEYDFADIISNLEILPEE